MAETDKPRWLERLSTLLLREPEDREQLIELLHGAVELTAINVCHWLIP